MQNPRRTELYGGAISCSIPDDFFNASILRQIPDNQEVFANSKSDQSIIFEIVEYQHQIKDENIAKFAHFHFTRHDFANKPKSKGSTLKSWRVTTKLCLTGY